MAEDLERISTTTSSSAHARFPIRITASTVEESREVQADRDEPVHGAIRRAFGAQCRIHQVLFTGAQTKALPSLVCCDRPRQAPPSPRPAATCPGEAVGERDTFADWDIEDGARCSPLLCTV